jgi:DNA primase small subunit
VIDPACVTLRFSQETKRQFGLQPSNHSSASSCFDIDMTDYDSVRRCCSEANICSRCWVFIAAAVKVLDRSMRDQFGYEHLLWVYSGRRGIHLWVSDQEAMELNDDERKAIANYLTVVGGGKEMKKKVNVRQGSKPLPPSIQ